MQLLASTDDPQRLVHGLLVAGSAKGFPSTLEGRNLDLDRGSMSFYG
jgi:hypothetical protein